MNEICPLSRNIKSVIFTKPPSLIRFFKKRLERSPHKFYLQQLMLFYPFRDEAELFPDDEEKCIALYLKNQDKIKIVKARLMPFLESVDEAQQLYEENREKQERHIEEAMGADLDPEMEQEAADVDEEDEEEHPDYYHIDIDQVEDGGDAERKRKQIFKAIALPDKDAQVIIAECDFLSCQNILHVFHASNIFSLKRQDIWIRGRRRCSPLGSSTPGALSPSKTPNHLTSPLQTSNKPPPRLLTFKILQLQLLTFKIQTISADHLLLPWCS